MADLKQAGRASLVTPHDSNNLANEGVLWIGGAGSGNLKVTTVGNQDIAIASVPVGIFPLRVKRVWSTGTDVTAIVLLW